MARVETGGRLSICSVNLARPGGRGTDAPPTKPHIRPHDRPAVRPSVRPSVHSLPRGPRLVSERSRWSSTGCAAVRVATTRSPRSEQVAQWVTALWKGAPITRLQEENSLRPDRLRPALGQQAETVATEGGSLRGEIPMRLSSRFVGTGAGSVSLQVGSSRIVLSCR